MLDSARSKLYAHDNLNQLTSYELGQLDGTKTGLTGTTTRSQTWDFDALGNFDTQTTDGNPETRTHDRQDEITGGPSVAYDSNGALTLQGDTEFTYDAWGSLISVDNSVGSPIIAVDYEYDRLGRRIKESRYTGATFGRPQPKFPLSSFDCLRSGPPTGNGIVKLVNGNVMSIPHQAE